MNIPAPNELLLLVDSLRIAGLTGVTVRNITLDDVRLSQVRVPLVAYGTADLHVTLDHRLGAAVWLLRDRIPTLGNCPNCRHVRSKSFMGEDVVDAFIGSESGRLFVGCAGAPTVSDMAAMGALLWSLPLMAEYGREACRILGERYPEPGFGLFAALSLADLYDSRPEMVSLPHPMSQLERSSAPHLALPPASEH